MRRSQLLTALFAALLTCAFSLAALAQSDGMKINNAKAYKAKERGVVVYNHDKHTGYGLKCTDCHHKYDPKQPGKNLWTEGDETACASCHAGAKPTSSIGLQQAYHKQCWGCHEKMPADKKLSYGPRSCAGCHEVK
ncbi:Acidic cytochrome c3 [Fundidesulfovibrio magnetotacticus]|uniref:Acidic cytochrome c3 n=1 Tax=Fundidesulfovibrio magnetotacticus TaxID=2730080 RepID=A0A6V8LTK0_9BACT|nr:cytochrome c3 family protein [Fundidesulfovibrio magnetotacticus]GFK92967.1 Acidic cytochrome c3 [Fundidesulfovibrio magnetotacticus]